MESGNKQTKLGSHPLAYIHGWEREREILHTTSKISQRTCEILALSNTILPELQNSLGNAEKSTSKLSQKNCQITLLAASLGRLCGKLPF